MDPARPYHHDSTFGPGPRRPLSLGDRCVWLARLDAARRARRITPGHELVAKALLRRLGDDGRLDPALATLAHDTGLSERTVQRAVRRLADAGLLTWQRRLVRVGWRAAQTSSAYLLTLGARIPAPPRVQRKPCMGSLSVAAPPAPWLEVAAARAALAEVARRRGLSLIREKQPTLFIAGGRFVRSNPARGR